MNRIVRTLILSTAVTAAAAAPIASANADPWRHWRHHDHNDAGVAIGAGLAGLAVGALIAGSANPADVDEPYYDDQRYYDDRRYDEDRAYIDPPLRRPRVVTYEDRVSVGLQPWSRAWFRYCEDRYRTFDPDRGTFRGNDGRDHFCTAG